MLTRRSFLKRTSLIALTPTVPAFLAQTARAAEVAQASNRKLVIIQLDGGNDGINTVVPYADEGYAKHRPTLRIQTDRLLKVNDQVGLHPAMRGASELLEAGKLAIVQGVGYPNPNRSHFRSMAIWHTARFDESEHDVYGWAGRALDGAQRQAGADAIYVGDEKIPIALRGRRSIATSLLNAEDLTVGLPVDITSMPSPNAASDITSFVNRTVTNAYATSAEVEAAIQASSGDARYPDTRLGHRMKLIGQLIKSHQPTRIYYTSQAGYDTHAIQLPDHFRLLSELSSAVKAFIDDMSASELSDDVVLMTFSEFGRRVNENGSVGTDHGTAGPVLLAGTPINAGLHGRTPSMTDLDDGDLRMHVDFRSLYHDLLTNWLQLPSTGILGAEFGRSASVVKG
jgi:uncharacterized protein (DUF1501 family)